MADKKFGNIRELNSGRVQARYYLPDGKQVTAGTYASVKAAQERLDEIEVDLRRKEHWDDRKSRTRFSVFMDEYMAHRRLLVSATEFENNRSYLKVHLMPAFGGLRMCDIDERKVDMWFAAMPATETRRNVHTFLRRAMKFAVKWDYVRTSPCNVLGARSDGGVPRPTWSKEDFYTVLSYVPETVKVNNSCAATRVYYREALEIMFAAHLRVGELAGLNASDLDRRTGRLRVERQVNRLGQTTSTKTGVIKNVHLLRVGISAAERLPFRIGSIALIPGPRGERMPRQSLQRVWHRAALAAGYENFHLHDVRHIGLSLVAATGAPMKDVMARGGHKSLESAMRYQHTDPERDLKVAQEVDRLLG